MAATDGWRRNMAAKHDYAGFVHTFNVLIPPDTYFSNHPEWFSEIDGLRKKDHSQLCLTNEEMRAELTKNLKEMLRRKPQATIASISQNDWYHYSNARPVGLLIRQKAVLPAQ